MDQGVTVAKIPEYLLDWYDSAERLSRVDPRYSNEAFFRIKARYFSNWFQRNFKPGQREIWIWGFGKAVRDKSRWLSDNGLLIQGYIDVRERPMSRHKVIHYDMLKEQANPFVLSYVGDRKGKQLISKYLYDQDFVEGDDDYMMT